MEIRPIRTEADYEAALAEVEVFFDMDSELEPGTPDGDRFDGSIRYERKSSCGGKMPSVKRLCGAMKFPRFRIITSRQIRGFANPSNSR
jgi:hypothetical protein